MVVNATAPDSEHTGYTATDAQLSPDGGRPLFVRDNHGALKPKDGKAIYVATNRGKAPRRVTPWNLGGGDNPDWSPDREVDPLSLQRRAGGATAGLRHPPRRNGAQAAHALQAGYDRHVVIVLSGRQMDRLRIDGCGRPSRHLRHASRRNREPRCDAHERLGKCSRLAPGPLARRETSHDVRMRFSINIPNFGDFADPRTVATVAAEAEQAGWDGLFVWDHVVHDKGKRRGQPFGDPWMLLTAAALATAHLRLGTMVTPIARRRPEQLARQVATLDALSGGRVIFCAGLGDQSRTSSAASETQPTQPCWPSASTKAWNCCDATGRASE